MSRNTLVVALTALLLAACSSVASLCASAHAGIRLNSCPSGSTYSYQYRYCVPNNPQVPSAKVKAIVRTAASSYGEAHHWKTYCSEDKFGFACILYTPDTTGHGLTAPNDDVAKNGRATKTDINGVPTVVFQHMSYVALGGSGCAITLYFGSTYPYTMDGCGPSGLARLRKALADDARAFP
jgi:hypothetical protein